MRGLIIDEPWISKILSGEKVWEMRTQNTKVRGTVALIRKGSGSIVGVATLSGSQGPLSIDQLRQSYSRHQVPMEEFESGRAANWRVAWELDHAHTLTQPVGYQHPNGAVIWVKLEPGIEAQVRAQLENLPVHEVMPILNSPGVAPDRSGPSEVELPLMVPVAKDGTWFGPHLLRAGQFTVGEKGCERRVDSLQEALAALAAMETPHWRRPNPRGNWGIVKGVRWAKVQDLTAGRQVR